MEIQNEEFSVFRAGGLSVDRIRHVGHKAISEGVLWFDKESRVRPCNSGLTQKI